MELAAHEARPVPTTVIKKQGQSKGPEANANPADVVLTTRAAIQKEIFNNQQFPFAKPKLTEHINNRKSFQ